MNVDPKPEKEGFPWLFLLLMCVLHFWLDRGEEYSGPLNFFVRTVGFLAMAVIGLVVVIIIGHKWISLLASGAIIFWFERFTNASSLYWVRDLPLVILSILLAFIASKGTRPALLAPRRIKDFSHTRIAWLSIRVLLISWFVLYAGDGISSRFSSRTAKERTFTSARSPIGVCLSGGGYRAALFHAGVLNALEHLNIHPAGLSTVSGGSIIGAFYARGCSPEDFLELVRNGEFNVKRALLSPWSLAHLTAATRIPGTQKGFLPFADFTRTDIQAEILDRLFLDQVKMDDIVRTNGPELLICTTDIAYGRMVGIYREGAVIQNQFPAAWRESFLNPLVLHRPFGQFGGDRFEFRSPAQLTRGRKLSAFVAASGAFPGAFAPFRQIPKPGFIDRETFVLADGGITDNLGITLLKTMMAAADSTDESEKAWANIQAIIVSDASALTVRKVPQRGLAEISAAMDVMYRSSGGPGTGYITNSPPAVLLSPSVILPQLPDERTLGRIKERAGWPWFNFMDLSLPNKMLERVPPHDVRNRTAPPNYSQLELDDLEFLVRSLPEPDRFAAEKLLPAAREYRSVMADHLQGRVKLTRGSSGYLEKRWQEARAGDGRLFEILGSRLRDSFMAFSEASTLKDNFRPDEAEAIYWLGQFVTIVNKSFIFDALSASKNDAANRATH